MKRLLIIFSFIGLCLAQTLPKLIVFDLEPIGMEERTGYAITKLIRDAFAESNKFLLIEAPADSRCYSPKPACSVAEELGADKAFIGSILQLGEKYTISFQFLNVPDCQVEFADKISTTELEEMDVLVSRIVNAIIENKPIEKTIEVGKVVETEVPTFKTREPFATITARTGYTFGAYPKTTTSDMFTLETSIAYETKDLFTEALFGGRNGKDANGVYFDLLLHKILGTEDFAPYIGGGLGIHQVTIERYEEWASKSDDGLAFTLSGGVLGFRTYFFRIIANARLSMTFTGEFGVVPDASFTFGITSPSFGTGKNSQFQTAGICLGGCLAAYLVTGLIVSLSQ